MEHMATSRTRKPARKTAKPASGKARVTKKAAATRKPSSAKPSGKSASARPARAPVRVAGAPTGAARTAARRVPAYITRPRDAEAGWAAPVPVGLPRQPSPAAHTPTRKPPKPRAPKPKAISHEQAVANLKALLEAKKRKEREGPSWHGQDG